MKHYFLYILLILSSLIAYCDEYSAMDVFIDGTVWKVNTSVATFDNTGRPIYAESTAYTYIEGTDEILGDNCLRLMRSEDNPGVNGELMAYIKVVNDRVYIVSTDYDTEWQILYDFNIEENSTSHFIDPPVQFNDNIYKYGYGFRYIGDSKYDIYGDVDVMSFVATDETPCSVGSQNICYNPMPDAAWIRGIGSLGGHNSIAHNVWDGVHQHLMCVYNGDKIFYTSPLNASITRTFDSAFHINSTGGKISIHGAKNAMPVEIYNASGLLILKSKCSVLGDFNFNNCPAGLYIVKVGDFTRKIRVGAYTIAPL